MTAVSIDSLSKFYFEPEKETICGRVVTPITDETIENYPTVVDRFFTRYYYVKPGDPVESYQVLFHSNRICLICLAPEHPALQGEISSLSFDIGNTDRSKNIVKGKGKKGGMPLQADSILAILTTKDGVIYKIPSCIRGKLIEVNTAFIEEPQRLHKTTEGEGYLAILLPKPEYCEEIKATLLTQEQYEEFLISNKKTAQKSNENTGQN